MPIGPSVPALLDAEGHEIVIPHEPEIRPMTAIKHVVLQSSLTNLEAAGHFARYASQASPELIQEIRTGLASAWSPIELAHAHYKACDALMLSSDELQHLGQRVGHKLQSTALVTSAKKVRDDDYDIWNAAGSMHRMWARMYQGGSVQVSKLGPKEKLLELRGFPLLCYRHYRHATLAVLTAAHAALGNQLLSVRIVGYREGRDEVQIRMNWG